MCLNRLRSFSPALTIAPRFVRFLPHVCTGCLAIAAACNAVGTRRRHLCELLSPDLSGLQLPAGGAGKPPGASSAGLLSCVGRPHKVSRPPFHLLLRLLLLLLLAARSAHALPPAVGWKPKAHVYFHPFCRSSEQLYEGQRLQTLARDAQVKSSTCSRIAKAHAACATTQLQSVRERSQSCVLCLLLWLLRLESPSDLTCCPLLRSAGKAFVAHRAPQRPRRRQHFFPGGRQQRRPAGARRACVRGE